MRARRDALNGFAAFNFFRICLAAAGLLLAAGALAAAANDTCLICHNPEGAPHVAAIIDSPHGELACADCHGDSGVHTRNPALEKPAVTFGPKFFADRDAQNASCLDCHRDDLEHWAGSPHDNDDMTCTACHGGHVVDDPVTMATAQAETCAGCHERGEHPLALEPDAYGNVVCSSCHEPHGTGAARMLALPTGAAAGNDTCLTCHNPEGAPHVAAIFDSPHGELACADCHGDPGVHTRNPALEKPAVTFGPKFFAGRDVQNGSCLDCHRDDLEHWAGSPHDNDDMTCTACHGGHVVDDPVTMATAQAETCAGCHERGEHPLALEPDAAGNVVCSTCHAPHGTGVARMLALPTGAAAGSDTCLTCHNPESSPAVHGIFTTAHGELACTDCHGDPGVHTRNPSLEKPAVTFGPDFFADNAAQTTACLDCHRDDLDHWTGSPHDNDDMTCTACHGVHASNLPALTGTSSSEVCSDCHKQAHAEQFQRSAEPVVCAECHAAHGSGNPLALAFTEAALADDRTCLVCHDPGRDPAMAGILASPHGFAGDPRTPESQDGCRSCHGDPGAHPLNPALALPAVVFGGGHASSVEDQNQACLNCHQADTQFWAGGTHAVEDVVCSDCHDSHVARQPVLQRVTQAEACYDCHQDVRAEVRLPSRHPILEAEVICSDCHAPHGSLKRGELVGLNLNDTCLGCHESLRGPFLFEHPPASEDCAACHVPHGAVHEPLLQSRGPFLCQECHVAEFHPSDLVSGAGLPSGQPSSSLLGRNCMNCHPKVHGSNHPSGARLTR